MQVNISFCEMLLCRCALLLCRCATCAAFTARITAARKSPDHGKQEEKALLKAQSEHIEMVKSWRMTQTRLNRLARAAAQEGVHCNNGDQFLKMDIDGCDESKFRTPRNVLSSKATEKLWRPQLHLEGVLIHGVPCY